MCTRYHTERYFLHCLFKRLSAGCQPHVPSCPRGLQCPVSTSTMVTTVLTSRSHNPSSLFFPNILMFDMANILQFLGHNAVFSNVQDPQSVNIFNLSGPQYFKNLSIKFEFKNPNFLLHCLRNGERVNGLSNFPFFLTFQSQRWL